MVEEATKLYESIMDTPEYREVVLEEENKDLRFAL